MTETNDRLIGMALGAAVGDALGAAVEFKPPGTFPPVTGYRNGGPHGIEAGEWTDDTSMSLALADSLKHGFDLYDQACKYLDWFQQGAYSHNGRCFDIGGQTSRSLSEFERVGVDLFKQPATPMSDGNGSLMRIAPVVVRYTREGAMTLYQRARQSSVTTHRSRICQDACGVLATILGTLAQGGSKQEALKPREQFMAKHALSEPIWEVYCEQSYRKKAPPRIAGGGYVVRCLEAALWCFDESTSFAECVLKAANLGDDADTTACVAGMLAGAHWSIADIPIPWLRDRAWAEKILDAYMALLEE